MNQQGYTLIELIVVIVIIGIMMTAFLPVIKTTIDNTEAAKCQLNQNAVEAAALQVYETEALTKQNPSFPNNMQNSYFNIGQQPFCPSTGNEYKTSNGGYDKTTGKSLCPTGIVNHSRKRT